MCVCVERWSAATWPQDNCCSDSYSLIAATPPLPKKNNVRRLVVWYNGFGPEGHELNTMLETQRNLLFRNISECVCVCDACDNCHLATDKLGSHAESRRKTGGQPIDKVTLYRLTHKICVKYEHCNILHLQRFTAPCLLLLLFAAVVCFLCCIVVAC